MRNQLTKSYNAASALVTATQNALAEKLQSVRETASLLYSGEYGIWIGETERHRGRRRATAKKRC